jgi:hypothetical protein
MEHGLLPFIAAIIRGVMKMLMPLGVVLIVVGMAGSAAAAATQMSGTIDATALESEDSSPWYWHGQLAPPGAVRSTTRQSLE